MMVIVADITGGSLLTKARAPARAKRFERIAFVAAASDEASRARDRLAERHGCVVPQQADIIVALGGGGLMRRTLHRYLNDRIPIYGMNWGTVGFLMNDYQETDLMERFQQAEVSIVHPLRMIAVDDAGNCHEALAINEVSLFRQTYQADTDAGTDRRWRSGGNPDGLDSLQFICSRGNFAPKRAITSADAD